MRIRIDDNAINGLMRHGLREAIELARHAHHTDLLVRINGAYRVVQADWLKHMVVLEDGENELLLTITEALREEIAHMRDKIEAYEQQLGIERESPSPQAPKPETIPCLRAECPYKGPKTLEEINKLGAMGPCPLCASRIGMLFMKPVSEEQFVSNKGPDDLRLGDSLQVRRGELNPWVTVRQINLGDREAVVVTRGTEEQLVIRWVPNEMRWVVVEEMKEDEE